MSDLNREHILFHLEQERDNIVNAIALLRGQPVAPPTISPRHAGRQQTPATPTLVAPVVKRKIARPRVATPGAATGAVAGRVRRKWHHRRVLSTKASGFRVLDVLVDGGVHTFVECTSAAYPHYAEKKARKSAGASVLHALRAAGCIQRVGVASYRITKWGQQLHQNSLEKATDPSQGND